MALLIPGVGLTDTGASALIPGAGVISDGAAVVISAVDADNSVTATQADVAITGSGFGVSAGSVAIEDGSISSSQSVDSWADSAIQIDVSQGNVRYGTLVLRVTNTDESTDTISITLSPPAGVSYIDIGTPDTEASNRITAVPDIAAGDQLEVSNVVGGSIGDITVYDDATWDAIEGVVSFDVRVHDQTTGWGSTGTQYTSAQRRGRAMRAYVYESSLPRGRQDIDAFAKWIRASTLLD